MEVDAADGAVVLVESVEDGAMDPGQPPQRVVEDGDELLPDEPSLDVQQRRGRRRRLVCSGVLDLRPRARPLSPPPRRRGQGPCSAWPAVVAAGGEKPLAAAGTKVERQDLRGSPNQQRRSLAAVDDECLPVA